ncbi:hypothetical protein DV735_g737, partial [Chaetothyriales sp. CBS 134920]
MEPTGEVKQRHQGKSPPEPAPPPSEPQPASRSNPQPAPARFYVPLNVALILLVTSYTLSAVYAPILDCDETYNYWEPLHFLLHGTGFETWEYSPQYAIRSWAYTLLHALPLAPFRLAATSKTTQFYLLRGLLGFVSAALSTRLYSAISRALHPRIGVLYLLVSAVSPGFFHASTAFLPSSFAMDFSALGLASFLSPPGPNGPYTARTIVYFGAGALLGWPFSAALILPLLASEWLTAFRLSGALLATLRRHVEGVVICLVILAAQVGIDSLFYRRFVVVPFRIVFYNVLNSSASTGPNIFGTEPWDYYIRNLVLNFNLFLLPALASLPLLLLQATFSRQSTTSRSTGLRTLTLLAPFYLWLAIFTLQPHKEERFMYPAYPFLALNAAIGLHILLGPLLDLDASHSPSSLLSRIPASVRLAIILPPFLLSIAISLLRTLGTTTSYSAPLAIYNYLPPANISTTWTTVCLGKDWYRFPTSFLLPPGTTPALIQSQFDGLLPGHFASATYQIPPGMNDANLFDPAKVVDVGACDYLVDSSFPSARPTDLEPDYAAHADTWQRVRCLPFLDAAATGFVGRVVWVPDLAVLPARWRRVWGEHCLLVRKSSSSSKGVSSI